MKAKTNMENRYMKRNTDLQISQTQKKCNRTEELLLEEIEVITAFGTSMVHGMWAFTLHLPQLTEEGGRGDFLDLCSISPATLTFEIRNKNKTRSGVFAGRDSDGL